jgi:outer membrane lipoprotein-sorting protein
MMNVMNIAGLLRRLLFPVLLALVTSTQAQDVEALMKRVKAKLELVNDYKADGLLKTDVPFMKVPESKVSIFYKKPDKFKIKKVLLFRAHHWTQNW